MKLIDYKNEIIAISKEENVSWDVAMDMFLANVRNAGDGVDDAPYYKGADEVDYAGLAKEIPAQGTQAYADMCTEFRQAFKK